MFLDKDRQASVTQAGRREGLRCDLQSLPVLIDTGVPPSGQERKAVV